MKFSNDQSSDILFYIGVPVNNKILVQTSCFKTDSIFAFLFFNLCASSITIC